MHLKKFGRVPHGSTNYIIIHTMNQICFRRQSAKHRIIDKTMWNLVQKQHDHKSNCNAIFLFEQINKIQSPFRIRVFLQKELDDPSHSKIMPANKNIKVYPDVSLLKKHVIFPQTSLKSNLIKMHQPNTDTRMDPLITFLSNQISLYTEFSYQNKFPYLTINNSCHMIP